MSRFFALAGMILALACFISCNKLGPDQLTGPKSHACMDDVQKFCAKVEKGEGRVIRCLEEHNKDLTPACQTFNAQRVVKLTELEEQKAKRAARVHGAVPPVCTADKPCKDKSAKAAGNVTPVEETKLRTAKSAPKSKGNSPSKKP